jgi:hypothetical protein
VLQAQVNEPQRHRSRELTTFPLDRESREAKARTFVA